MDEIKTSLPKLGYKGEFDDSEESRIKFSHDASMFEIKPKLITSPRDAKDVELLVKYIGYNKKTNPELSLTARSAGTDMSGGAINDSIIVDSPEVDVEPVARLFSKIFRDVPKVLSQHFYVDWNIPIKEEIKVGHNLLELKEYIL